MGIERRHLIKSSLALSTLIHPLRGIALSDSTGFLDNMDLGVASGEPREDSIILWTRIPAYARAGQLGSIGVDYVVALAPSFKSDTIVAHGTTYTNSHRDFTVNVKIEGLAAYTIYYYRFSIGNVYVSITGRTKTAPAANSQNQTIKFATMCCQNYQYGFYTAYASLIKEELDFCVHLGDFIYEDVGPNFTHQAARSEGIPTAITLEQYRAKYRLYLSDPNLREARRLFPFVHVWDDHEVADNYSGTWTDPIFLGRKAVGYKAYGEYLPVELNQKNPDLAPQTVRSLKFGSTLEVFCMDLRQFRSDLTCTSAISQSSCLPGWEGKQTTLGETQKKWLFESLGQTTSQWKVLLSSVMFMPLKLFGDKRLLKVVGQLNERLAPGKNGIYLNLDQWDGFPSERRQLTNHLYENNIDNVIFCSGDIHVNFGGTIFVDPDDINSPSVGYEVTTCSLSSPGFSDALLGLNMEDFGMTGLLLKNNPHMNFANLTAHGYCVIEAAGTGVVAKRVVVDTIKKLYANRSILRHDYLAVV